MNASAPRRAGRPRTNRQPIDRPPRDEAIAVASRLFAEKGFAATTMREIAERSGLQQSSIYYYFKSKDEILEAIVAEVNRVVLEGFARIAADGGSPGLRLFRTLRLDVTMLCGLPYDVNEILRLPALQEERFAAYWKERQQLNDEVEALLAEGVADGEFLPMDPRLAALSLLSNDEATQNWYRPLGEHRLVGDYEPAEIGGFLATMALQAFLVDRRRLAAIRRRADELDAVR
ncbi:MAG: TetR/AcrR family transcriptional regulator [Acidimicrobiia bacterium]